MSVVFALPVSSPSAAQDDGGQGCVVGGVAVATVLTGEQCTYLVELFAATDGPSWTFNSGWMTPTDPCGWYGVDCGETAQLLSAATCRPEDRRPDGCVTPLQLTYRSPGECPTGQWLSGPWCVSSYVERTVTTQSRARLDPSTTLVEGPFAPVMGLMSEAPVSSEDGQICSRGVLDVSGQCIFRILCPTGWDLVGEMCETASPVADIAAGTGGAQPSCLSLLATQFGRTSPISVMPNECVVDRSGLTTAAATCAPGGTLQLGISPESALCQMPDSTVRTAAEVVGGLPEFLCPVGYDGPTADGYCVQTTLNISVGALACPTDEFQSVRGATTSERHCVTGAAVPDEFITVEICADGPLVGAFEGPARCEPSTAYQPPVVVNLLANDLVGYIADPFAPFDWFLLGSGNHLKVIGSELTAVVAGCAGLSVTVDLGAGDSPTDGDDVILGTAGDDVVAAGAGDDIICGLGGNDKIWGQGGDDVIHGGDGDDRLRGGAGEDTILGGVGVDDLNGGSGEDWVDGGEGNDAFVRGGVGDDIVLGGPGDDAQVSGNGGSDVVAGGPGNDRVTGGPRPDRLIGGSGDDMVIGNKGADVLKGGIGNDTLTGGGQPDVLEGGDGDDVLTGGGQADVLVGGLGSGDVCDGSTSAVDPDTPASPEADQIVTGCETWLAIP